MDENNVNTNTNDATGESGSKQSLGSKLSSGISKANQLRQDYQNGGLTGVAKNAINNKIHDKIGSKVDAAKAKAEEVIKKLEDGANWSDLVKEYSEDSGSVDSDGLIENFTKGDVKRW